MNDRPHLQGLRVLNTRPLHQSYTLSRAIHDAGGVSIDLPALAIEATEPTWFLSMPDVTAITQSIFISANAANYFFAVWQRQRPFQLLTTAIGDATALALKGHGVTVNHIPLEPSSEHVLALPNMQAVANQLILIIKGEGGRNTLETILTARGAQVKTLSVYRRILPPLHQQYQALWRNDAVDILLFTSEQTMQNVFALFGKNAHTWICNKPCLVISERLATTAATLGINTVLQCRAEEIVNFLGLTYGKKQ